MSVRDINDVNYDEAVKTEQVSETVQGQPQPEPRERDNGEVTVNESKVKLDQPVLDPNHPLAVQVPEGVGARADEDELLSDRYAAGTAEDQFTAASTPPSKPKAKASADDKS
jgi:hypothetical protein